jgi:hypothetical protein
LSLNFTHHDKLPFFLLGGAVTFTLGPWSSLLRRIPDKNDRCAFTRGSLGVVMIFFENNKVLGVEPNRVLNILEGILKNKHGLKRAGVKKVSALVVHVYTLIVYLRG